MKKILLILPILLLTIGCDVNTEPDVSYEEIHNCLPMPAEIPDTFASGTPVPWDCETQMFYNDGDLKLHYNDEGGLIAIEKVR